VEILVKITQVVSIFKFSVSVRFETLNKTVRVRGPSISDQRLVISNRNKSFPTIDRCSTVLNCVFRINRLDTSLLTIYHI